MALVSHRVDDLDNSVLPEDHPLTTLTVTDAREGSFSVQLDLSEANFKALLKAVEKYRKVGSEPVITPRDKATSNGGASAEERERNAAIRKWAKDQGEKVSDRGALPKEVKDKYDRAHPVTVTSIAKAE